jgi:hypothetical protein
LITIIVEHYKTKAGCDSTLTKIFTIKTATNEIGELKYNIMAIPNPAKDLIRFESKNELEILGFEMYTSLGQVILNSNNKSKLPVTIKIDHLASGLYWINFKTKAGFISSSFIKQ